MGALLRARAGTCRHERRPADPTCLAALDSILVLCATIDGPKRKVWFSRWPGRPLFEKARALRFLYSKRYSKPLDATQLNLHVVKINKQLSLLFFQEV
jgi:hypothetical protein